jgi:tetratricopeptide (TPR) repeat protein
VRAREALQGSDPARAAVCLVEGLRRLGREEEAIRIVEEYASSHPGTHIEQLALGRLERLRRNPQGAEGMFRRTLELELGAARSDSLVRLVAIEQLANILQDTGRFGEATDLHERSLKLARLVGDSLVLISSSYGLGYCFVPSGRHEEAERVARSALEGASRLDLPLWVGDAQALLALLCWLRLDLDGTLQHYGEAAEAYGRAGDVSRQASCLRKMAATHRSRGEYPSAIEGLHRARRLALGAGNAAEAAFALEHLGSISYDLGNLERARMQWEEALREGRETWPPEWRSAALLNIGSLLVTRENYDEALRYLEQALQVLEGSESRLAVPGTLSVLGQCLRKLGRLEEALARLQEAASLARENDIALSEAESSVELGLCYLDLDRLDEAERALDRAADLSAGQGFYDFEPKIRFAQSLVARRGGKLETSLRHLEAALEIAESVRSRSREASEVQQGVFAGKRCLYEAAVDVLYEMHRAHPSAGHDRSAFHVAQCAKARSFADLLTEAEVHLRVRADPTYQRREQQILERIAALTGNGQAGARAGRSASVARQEIARLEDDLAILEKEVRGADPRYAAIRYPNPPGLERIQAEGLGPGDLLLEYLVGEESSYVWAVTHDHCRFVQIPSREVLQGSIRELLPILGDYNLLGSDPAYFLPPVQALSNALLGPVLEQVRANKAILIAPDDILHILPFEALLSEEVPSGTGEFSSLPFLVKTVDVSYVASGGLLAGSGSGGGGGGPGGRTDAGRPSNPELLLIGDPVLDRTGEAGAGGALLETATGGRLFPLGDVQEEMRALREILGVERIRELQGDRATHRELRRAGAQGPYRFIHFASHGIYNERRPRFSGILLSADAEEGDDGFLTIDEVFALDLHCDQVVLSACFSAMGEHVRGEGIVGLTRGLQYAGARQVVAGLWAVSGWATARFMRKYYEILAQDPSVSGVHALAEAKRWMIEQPLWIRDRDGGGNGSGSGGGDLSVEPAHPFFWAPFVAFGGGSR